MRQRIIFFPYVAAQFTHHLIQSYAFSLFWRDNYINSLVQCLVRIFMLIIGRKIVDEDRGKEIKRPDRNCID